MYGLPPDFDATLFIGSELQQISFTVNTVYLTFDKDISITLESSFSFQSDRNSETERHVPPVRISAVMSLVGRQICSASATRDGTLVLEFTGGGVLTCIDDSKEYESYRICLYDKEIIV